MMNSTPTEPHFTANRSAAIRALLVNIAEPGTPENLRLRRARRVRIVVPAVIATLVLTAGAVVAVQAQVTRTDHINCFARAELNMWGEFPGARVTSLEGTIGDSEGGPVSINDALAACSDLWAQHALDASIESGVRSDPVDRTFSYPVPDPLTVCVMSDGMAAVIPGASDVCGRLGLAERAK
ncbi:MULTISPECIES: hypothetical protein [Cryobacterium]|nr:hypothetical protein [Cryobacterium sp. CAN_C3]MEC5156071.1 hypothetical protein [Cryobacterium sp. CAN_C3]